jgi:hypothetical protein
MGYSKGGRRATSTGNGLGQVRGLADGAVRLEILSVTCGSLTATQRRDNSGRNGLAFISVACGRVRPGIWR